MVSYVYFHTLYPVLFHELPTNYLCAHVYEYAHTHLSVYKCVFCLTLHLYFVPRTTCVPTYANMHVHIYLSPLKIVYSHTLHAYPTSVHMYTNMHIHTYVSINIYFLTPCAPISFLKCAYTYKYAHTCLSVYKRRAMCIFSHPIHMLHTYLTQP